jgi:hypothetical protein
VCLIDELKTVPDKIGVEDKYVTDCPIEEQKTEPDKLYNSTTMAVRVSKSSKKSPITKKKYFFIVKERRLTYSSPLLILHLHICGLRGKNR